MVHLKTRERKVHKGPPEAEKTFVMSLVNPDFVGILVAFALAD